MAKERWKLTDEQWKKSNHYFQNPKRQDEVAEPGRITARSSRASCGYSAPERLGPTCQNNIQVPQPAGEDLSFGKSREYGSISGGHSSGNSIKKGVSNGLNVLWTAVLCRLKKGLQSWQDQAWQGLEAYGGGRRQGYSFGSVHSRCQPT